MWVRTGDIVYSLYRGHVNDCYCFTNGLEFIIETAKYINDMIDIPGNPSHEQIQRRCA